MLVSKRNALLVCLLAIALYWTYQIATLGVGHSPPPAFSEFVLDVAIRKIVVIVAIVVLLKLAGEGADAVGLSRRDWPQRLAIGLAVGTVMFLVFNVGLASVMGALLPRSTAASVSLASYFRDPENLLLWLPIGIIGGGVVEELQRIFVLTRFEQQWGRTGLVLGVVASSVMFGLGHLYQGTGIALATAVSGAALALLYLRRRSALEPIVAHAVSDVFAVLAATLLAHPHP